MNASTSTYACVPLIPALFPISTPQIFEIWAAFQLEVAVSFLALMLNPNPDILNNNSSETATMTS